MYYVRVFSILEYLCVSIVRFSPVPPVPPRSFEPSPRRTPRYFPETSSRSLLPRPMHQHGADKHTAGTHSIFFFFLLLSGKNMLLLSSLRVAWEVEKQACLPTDGQKEIFIWSPCEVQERTRAYSPGFFRPRQERLVLVAILYPWCFFLPLVVRELGIKKPGEEGEGPSAPQRLLEREITARTERRGRKERNRCECVKYNVTEGLPNTRPTPVVPYAWASWRNDATNAALRFDCDPSWHNYSQTRAKHNLSR